MLSSSAAAFASSNKSIHDIPISLRWKISKATLFENPGMLCISTGAFYTGKLPGVKYYLVLAGFYKNDKQITLGLVIEKTDPSSKINVNFKLSIPSAAYIYEGNEEISDKKHIIAGDISTLEKFIDPLNNYFVNDDLIITMEAVISVEKVGPPFPSSSITAADNHCCQINKKVNLGQLLWNRDEDKDFAIIIGEKEIKVHKNVIGVKSSVFDRMIKSGLTESKESKVSIIDFSFKTVETAIKFCYGFDEDIKFLTLNIAADVMQFADKYDITDLKAFMEAFLATKISPMHVCEISNASILSSSTKLREKCFNFLLECNQKRIFVKDLEILDKDFGSELLKASFSHFIL